MSILFRASVSRIANGRQKLLEKPCLGITLHGNPSLILLMAMAIQSNFRFKAMLDLFGRLAMQPTETTMALSHNSQTCLSSVHQPLFLQPPLFGLFTLQFKCLKVSTWLMSLLAGSVTIHHVVGTKTTFSFVVS